MISVGIDAGSRTIKIVVLDGESGRTIAAGHADQGTFQERLAMELFDRLLGEAGMGRDRIGSIIATGYGRNLIGIAERTVTEITCHARGVREVIPNARTIIEIGGQDSKLIRLDGRGAVQDFEMNDRCAAGTGRFLEIVAERIGDGLAGLGELAARAERPAAISSMCAVFAESEIIGLLASGTPPESIAAGVQATVAARVCAMAGRRIDEPIVFTGGVALIPGMREALAEKIGRPVEVAPEPLMTGALGAALIAHENMKSN